MTEFEKKFKNKTNQNFNEYYKQYKPKLSWYLTRYTKNLESAEEFADMAFIQGLEKIDTYNNEIAQFITWVTSIAVNLVIKDYKDKQKSNLISIDKELSENLTLNTFLKHEDDDEEKIFHAENKAKCDLIKDVIYSLPDKYKKVMIMRELDKKTYKDIAKSITKEYNVDISDSSYFIDNNEYFHSATISNKGYSDIKINLNNDNDGYTIIVSPNEKKTIQKDDNINNIEIVSNDTSADITIKKSTNLSTIKSQIKKGRFLIRKKVKRKFDIIEKNGVE